MRRQHVIVTLLVLLCIVGSSFGQAYFPDLNQYQTLVCDFHMHTVFSDGQVWPSVRVDEAIREKLDAIAITDHIEYQPHKDDIPTNHERPFEIAEYTANKKKNKVLVIKGAEITRDTPPGHYNAIFLNTVKPLDTKDLIGAMTAAKKQDSFLFWNHHTWQGKEKGQWEAIQQEMYEKKLLNGMEVANGKTYYPQAHKWCLEKGLTMFGNSDIHAPSLNYKYTAKKHRTLTLVFATERTVKAIKEALVAGRTAVWHENTLIGKEEFLRELFFNSILSNQEYVDKEGVVGYRIENYSLIDFELKRIGDKGPEKVTIPANKTVHLEISEDDVNKPGMFRYEVTNLLVQPGKGMIFETN